MVGGRQGAQRGDMLLEAGVAVTTVTEPVTVTTVTEPVAATRGDGGQAAADDSPPRPPGARSAAGGGRAGGLRRAWGAEGPSQEALLLEGRARRPGASRAVLGLSEAGAAHIWSSAGVRLGRADTERTALNCLA